MGGFGSTRWDGIRTRQQVESCFMLVAPRTRRAPPVLASRKGIWRWPKYGFYVFYSLRRCSPDQFTMTLDFTCQGRECRQFVRIKPTQPNYGGKRWWFMCPDCDRRAGKLFLPPRRLHFRCRACHDLSYESAQNSGALYYAIYKLDARYYGCSSRIVREALRAGGGYLVADMVGKPEILTMVSG